MSQPADMRMPVAVVGSGYVGTVVAVCWARMGSRVFAVESNLERLKSLQDGVVPFYEVGLEEAVRDELASGKLSFTDDIQTAVKESKVVFLCVGTPPLPDGRPDLSGLEATASSLAPALDDYKVIVNKSTVPIGSVDWVATAIEHSSPDADLTQRFGVVANPEFLREGSAIADFLHPDRIVLGSHDERALQIVEELYRPIVEQSFAGGRPEKKPPLVKTSPLTAEAVKYASNGFLAMKISYINEIANICDLVGADVSEVAAAMGLDERINPHFLAAGVGWGGSCFGKDLAALITAAQEFGYQPQLLRSIIELNDRQRGRVVEKLQRQLGTLRGRRIAIFGLAFKPGTDDTRDSPAIDIASRLSKLGASVVAHDPVVREVPGGSIKVVEDPYKAAYRADAVVLTTEWPEYLGLDFVNLRNAMRGRLFIDGRNELDAKSLRDAGLRYVSIGRRSAKAETRIAQ